MTSATKPTDESWNKYWEHGFLTSCRNAFSGNYDGSLKSVWLDFFRRLPRGARILDICTGNGAIAMIANELSATDKLDFEIHGIDSAAIRPLETVKTDRHLLEGIIFHGETPAEDTPFEDGSFTAITGQYAFEYTDEKRCIGELARIAAPGAALQMVIHHTDSIVMETSREEISNGRIIFDDTDIFGRARSMLEILAADERDPTEVLNELPNSVSTPELKCQMNEGENHEFVAQMQEKARFADARLTTIDGVRADFADGWGLVRASNTTPILVLRFEADTEEALQRIKAIFRQQMLAINGQLRLPF